MNPQQPDTVTSLRDEARELLRRLTGASEADFHDGQYEAIHALVADRARTLVVQRTGWGKSAVYFISSLLLRARGTGPALIISPLLSLMRDQVAAASPSRSKPTSSTCSWLAPSGSTTRRSASSGCRFSCLAWACS